MRVGLDLRTLGKNRTGDETVFFALARYLPKIDPSTTYILFLGRRSKQETDEILFRLYGESLPTNIEVCAHGRAGKFFWNMWEVPRLTRSFAIDVYHTQYIAPFFLPKKTRLVTHVHDVSFAAYGKYIASIDRFFLTLLIPRSFRASSLLVAVSEFTKKEIMRYYGTSSEKIAVVPNAVLDASKTTQPTQEEEPFIFEKYTITKPYILHVGTLQPRKNIPTLLMAFARIKKDLPELQFVLTGNRQAHHFDAKIDEIIRKYHLEKSVVFAGYVANDDIPLLIKRALCVASASLYEGFGLVPLETIVHGGVVVASRIEAHREVLGEEYEGMIVPDDIAKWEKMLYSLCTELSFRERLREQLKRRCSLFSWEKSAKLLTSLYQSLE
jgi:glycosyltransferase involved in cell wall biosynthesis